MSTKQNIRCAIYTRKSSEEGLEQEFNSLHAQREASAAYIASQKHEGWQLVKTSYDDGGISGGTMERPALQQLLCDIKNQRIDVIVVYKVDRLTRSLADFARMVELFDAYNVSFVSVTQQFNTTSSMGRLTLNVLLSFAQFEREVTGERIRDKIAASKQKGMWMGGNVPLGYDVKERKLIISKAEADTVRHIFLHYLELGCVRLLKEDLDRRDIKSKIREKGTRRGGASLSRGALYNMLSNPIYIGQIRHKRICHPGQHEAIIEQALWDQVQQRLQNNGPVRQHRFRKTMPSLLLGKLFDESGDRLTPSHANKKGKRYRYYISQKLTTGTKAITETSSSDATTHSNTKTKLTSNGWRLPAQEIEQTVVQSAKRILQDHTAITSTLRESGIAIQHIPEVLKACNEICKKCDNRDKRNTIDSMDVTDAIMNLIERVELHQHGLRITLSLKPLVASRIKRRLEADLDSDTPTLTITQDITMQMKRRGIEMRLILNDGQSSPARHDPTLIKVIAKAHRWFDDLVSGRVTSIATIASKAGVSDGYVGNILPLAFLAPDIIDAIIAGHQPADLTAERLIKHTNLPADWNEQRRVLGSH